MRGSRQNIWNGKKKNPLLKRIPRDLRRDLGKYIALFLFMSLMIGFVSGFLVADGSMIRAYKESFTKYNVENGHFVTESKLTKKAIENIEEEDVRLYELFYKDKICGEGKTVRVFKLRTEINKADVMEGHLPKKDDEIVIDRLFAENNGIAAGDVINVDGLDLMVCGMVALPDYSSMFKNNSDMMFDATNFSIAMMTDEGYGMLDNGGLTYCYAWINEDREMTDSEQKKFADDLMEVVYENSMLGGGGSVGSVLWNMFMASGPFESKGGSDDAEGPLQEFVPRQDNQAIRFAGEDMGADKVMFEWLLYIVTAVLAFAFAITTRSTIESEARAIGTLRATGYSRKELLLHYITLPLIVTFAAAVVGNILGYTVLKYTMMGMYYHSYSLPTYVTVWSGEAFVKTTLIPCLILIAVELLVVGRSLSLPPLQFLRRDMRRRRQTRAVKLPALSFATRFRLRIMIQNRSTYLILFSGLFLASVIFLFGSLFDPLLQNYKGLIQESMFCEYQYILKDKAETESPRAEKFAAYTLKNENDEDITVYGIERDSRYVDSSGKFSNKGNRVLVSDGYMEKYGLKEGEIITLKEEFKSDRYSFAVGGTYDYPAALTVFMDIDRFREIFGLDDDYYSGYFSDEELTDIKESRIATVITENDLAIAANQLEDSMGKVFKLFLGFAVLLFILMIYLLARLVTERNAYSISMLKILGYTNGEAGRFYNLATFIAVVISMILSGFLGIAFIRAIYYVMMQRFSGWLTFYVAPWGIPVLVLTGIACYLIVSLALMRRIRSIPMSTALRDME